jgi:hypothetical protein
MPTVNNIPTDQFNRRNKPHGHVRSWFHMVHEHAYSTLMAGLRRCIEAVRFLAPICDPFFGITVAIEHFVRFTVKEQWSTTCNCRGKPIVSSGSGFQTSDIMHGALPLHSFDPCLPVLLSSYVHISTSGSLRRWRIFDEDESPC